MTLLIWMGHPMQGAAAEDCLEEGLLLRPIRRRLSLSKAEEHSLWKAMEKVDLGAWLKRLQSEKMTVVHKKKMRQIARLWRSLGFLEEAGALDRRLAKEGFEIEGAFYTASDAMRGKKRQEAKRWLSHLDRLLSLKETSKEKTTARWSRARYLLWGRLLLEELEQEKTTSSEEMLALFRRIRKEPMWLRRTLWEAYIRRHIERLEKALREKKSLGIEAVRAEAKERLNELRVEEKEHLLSLSGYLEEASARLLLLQGMAREAASLFERQKGRLNEARRQLFLGYCAEAMQEKDKALKHYDLAFSLALGSSLAHKAFLRIRELAKMRYTPSWRYQSARHLSARGELQAAQRELQALLKETLEKGKRQPSQKQLWRRGALLSAEIAFKEKDYRSCLTALSPLALFEGAPSLERKAKLLSVRCLFRKKQDESGKKAKESREKKKERIDLYARYAEAYPKTAEGRKALWWAAQLYSEASLWTKAIQMYRRYQLLYPKDKDASSVNEKLGLIAYQRRRFTEARQAFSRLLTVNREKKARGFFWIAKSYEQEGNQKQARLFFERAFQQRHGYYSVRAALRFPERKLKTAQSPLQLLLDEEKERSLLRMLSSFTRKSNQNQAPSPFSNLCRQAGFQQAYEALEAHSLAGWLHQAKERMRSLRPFFQGAEGILRQAQLWEAMGHADQIIRLAPALRLASRSYPREAQKILSSFQTRFLFPIPFPGLYLRFSKQYAIDPFLFLGLTRQESLFQPHIISSAGARGIAQIMPKDAKKIAQRLNIRPFSILDLFRPEINLLMGFAHFRAYLDRHQGEIPLTLAAYNAGPAALQRWLKQSGDLYQKDPEAFFAYGIGYEETRRYIPACLRWAATYRHFLNHSSPTHHRR
jgi:soluble lytic murein transglycosylase-like protein